MKKIMILVALFIALASNSVNAQTEISPEKQKAIKELVSLVAKDNNAEELVKSMTTQFSSMYEEIIKNTLDNRKDLTPTEKISLEKNLIVEMKKFTLQLQDKLMEKLDYNKLVEEISITVYDKYYSLEEINDLVAFYRTPTGQKTLKMMQPMMLESMQLTQERLTPKLIATMDEMREEQKKMVAKIVNDLNPPKPKSKR